VYGDARGTAALDLAEARAIADVWKPGQVRVANLNGQTGHLHATTPMLATVCAAATVGTGWAPRLAAARDPLPELAEHLGAEVADDDDRGCLVTAANWGGTYASVVLRGWSAG
jgi:3-oxoacyl-[acyl-carrier-protein] synthase II